jgi:hypothetical protein
MRDKNLVVAAALLPLFERTPKHWEAISYLNSSQPRGRQTFATYLREWHERCPERHRPFVVEIAREFEIAIAVTAAGDTR